MTDRTPPFFPVAVKRMHEVCGPGAYMFAFALAAQLGGRTIFVRESWRTAQINPLGFGAFVDPALLTLCHAEHQMEALAVGEEALRSGVASLVVVVLSKPLGLTEGRRLQLAARAGGGAGLAILPEGMGSNAAETRWRCAPVFDPVFDPESDTTSDRADSTLQEWALIKNKSGTLGAWHVRWNRETRRLTLVSPAGE